MSCYDLKIKILSEKLLYDLGEIEERRYRHNTQVYLEDLEYINKEYYNESLEDFKKYGILI